MKKESSQFLGCDLPQKIITEITVNSYGDWGNLKTNVSHILQRKKYHFHIS